MSDPFSSVNLLRIILEGETDANSPGSEELMSQIRENWEVLLMLFGYTGDAGAATLDPPNDTTGVLTDTGQSWNTDEHNGRSLVMVDGAAAGNIYTIDDTTSTTLICTGDNLFSDGVRLGDNFKVFYDLKNPDAHNHDDTNSRQVVLPAGLAMLPPIMSEEEAKLAGVGTVPLAWQDFGGGVAVALLFKIYIPPNPQTIRCWGRFARDAGNTNVKIRFRVDTETSTEVEITTAIGVYNEIELTLDCVNLTPGWNDLTFQDYTGNNPGENARVQGFSFCWEPT